MKRLLPTFGVVAAVTFSLLLPAASASAQSAHDVPRITVEQGVLTYARKASPQNARQNWDAHSDRERRVKTITARKAKAIALRHVGGNARDEAYVERANKNTYKVRIVKKDGRIFDVLIDARSGQVKN